MSNADAYTAGFTIGYGGVWGLFVLFAYFVGHWFGYGYVGAELATGYAVWMTAYRWELLERLYLDGLNDYV